MYCSKRGTEEKRSIGTKKDEKKNSDMNRKEKRINDDESSILQQHCDTQFFVVFFVCFVD